MATKRTPIKRDNVVKITPQLLDVYALVLETHCDDAREDEYREASMKLHHMLGRKPWQEEIFHTLSEDAPPDYMVQQGEWRINDWTEAHAIRAQLDKALIERES